MPIRILIVDDDPLVRAGLRLMLSSVTDFEVIGEAGDGVAAVALAKEQPVDVILMDLRMAGMDGIVATARIRSLPDPPEVIALTTWDVDDALIGSIEAGASGFLLKSAAPEEIVAAVRAAVAGDAVLSPRSAKQLIDQVRHNPAAQRRQEAEAACALLTDREREIAAVVGLGLTNVEIGARLFLAPATVKTHLSAIQEKLRVTGRVGIAIQAERAGLVG